MSDAKMTDDALVTVKRWLGGATAGCHGIRTFEVGDRTTMSGVDPVRILGRDVEDGTVLRVTVEVISEPKTPRRPACENPWPAHLCPPGKGKNARTR